MLGKGEVLYSAIKELNRGLFPADFNSAYRGQGACPGDGSFIDSVWI